ncbi:peptidoglycan/xylan/chitin deacetylase (PgdA/CDA1 family) [Bradyrhizobium sp. LM3.6]
MKQLRNNVIRAGLGALYFSGAHHLLRPLLSGVGAIFMLHHVRPGRDAAFQPNRHLEVTPEFLRATLSHLRSHEIDIVSMDELHERLVRGRFDRRFAAFTLDDGYRDNLDYALPVLREFDAPLAVYVASDFAEGTGRLWWEALEAVIAKTEQIEVKIGNAALRLDATTPAAKQAAFDRVHDWLRALPGEHDLKREIEALCTRYGVDMTALCRGLCLSWDEVKRICRRPPGHDRCPHHQPLQSRQAKRRDRHARDSREPRADRAGARPQCPASCLSLWRPPSRRRA